VLRQIEEALQKAILPDQVTSGAGGIEE